MYCNPPWSLDVNCLENLRTCRVEPPKNTKAVFVFPEWPKFKCDIIVIKLSRRIPIVRFLLGKRHA